MGQAADVQLKPLYVWLLATALVTICALVYAAHASHGLLALAASGMFAAVAIIVAILVNRSVKGAAYSDGGGAEVTAAGHNATLMAIIFGWGGLAILSAYYLTDLFWHHAWQYGIAMSLAAVLAIYYKRSLANDGSQLAAPAWLARSAWLALAQAVAAGGGLAFMIAAGKLSRHNSDWIANHVFVAGGGALIVVSVLAFLAQRSILRRN